MSQNLIVPFLGLRVGPLHWAEPDTFDEAVTITALLDGLARFYAKSASTAATTGAAPAPVNDPATTNPVSTANSAFAAAFQSAASTSAVPAAKKAKTGVAATSKEADAASSMKLSSFFNPK